MQSGLGQPQIVLQQNTLQVSFPYKFWDMYVQGKLWQLPEEQ